MHPCLPLRSELTRSARPASRRREEHFCRFCNSQLPDWKGALTPNHLTPAEPIMVVTLGSEVHRIKVKPGPEGMAEFQGKIRKLFNIPEDVDFEASGRWGRVVSGAPSRGGQRGSRAALVRHGPPPVANASKPARGGLPCSMLSHVEVGRPRRTASPYRRLARR